jgi:predicted CoA-binding protein
MSSWPTNDWPSSAFRVTPASSVASCSGSSKNKVTTSPPVNPGATEVEDKRCFAHVSEIDPPVKAALLFTPADRSEEAVDDCASAHVDHIWMHRGAGGPGAVNERAVTFCYEHGISVVAGECPMMFLGHPGWPHRVHAFMRKLEHIYPH